MKKFLLSAVSLLLVLGSCQNDLEETVLSNGQKVVTASIEKQNSRLAVSYDETNNVFSLNWNTGDAFKVFSNNTNPTTYNWSSGDAFTQNGNDPVNPKYAIYPAANVTSVTGDKVTMTLSATPNVANINLPMWAGSPTNGNYAFKHLAAGLKFTLNEIPAGYNSLIVEADKPISGTFTATLTDNNPALTSTSTTEADKKVTVSFTAATNGQTKNEVFYIPLPSNTYGTLKVSVSNGQNTKELRSWANLTVARGKMYYTTAVVDAETVDAANTILAGIGEVPTTVNLTAAIDASQGAFDIPDAAKNVTMDFGVAPKTDEETPIIINQNKEKASGEASSVLNINMPAGAINLYAEINTPTTTTTLKGGTYKKVIATTATNTLIVEAGTSIEELIVKDGNVVIKEDATVGKLLRVLTFEDEDAKFEPYNLDYVNDYEGKDIYTWSDLIDDPQYGGPLTYGNGYASGTSDAMYYWYDQGNTELYHMFPDNYSYCFAGGGHAISKYWGSGYTDEDRNKHIANYYGQEYVDQWAGKPGADAALGWFSVQMMVPIKPHSGKNFAVHYGYKDFFSFIENLPEIRFEDGKARVIDHMYVTNTNYTLNQLVNGVKSEEGNTFGGNWTGLNEDAWLKIVAYGFDDVEADADAEPISEVEFYLVQGENVVTDWQKWDLSELGKVAKVRFNFEYSEDMGGNYGFTIPGYFAYDDIAVRFEK